MIPENDHFSFLFFPSWDIGIPQNNKIIGLTFAWTQKRKKKRENLLCVFILCGFPNLPHSLVLSFSACLLTSAYRLPPSLFFYFSYFCTPVMCFVCCDFPCGYLSGDSMPHPGTGPQFPRQLYNCFGCVPNATGYRGIIDVKRNMYEMRRCGSVHMVLYRLTRSHLTVFQ